MMKKMTSWKKEELNEEEMEEEENEQGDVTCDDDADNGSFIDDLVVSSGDALYPKSKAFFSKQKNPNYMTLLNYVTMVSALFDTLPKVESHVNTMP